MPEARQQCDASVQRLMTEEEYLDFEERSETRHEYINGALYAMSGASLAHNQISFRLATSLSKRLRGGPCKVFLLDLQLKLELPSDRIFYYPDVMAACRREGANAVLELRSLAISVPLAQVYEDVLG